MYLSPKFQAIFTQYEIGTIDTHIDRKSLSIELFLHQMKLWYWTSYQQIASLHLLFWGWGWSLLKCITFGYLYHIMYITLHYTILYYSKRTVLLLLFSTQSSTNGMHRVPLNLSPILKQWHQEAGDMRQWLTCFEKIKRGTTLRFWEYLITQATIGCKCVLLLQYHNVVNRTHLFCSFVFLFSLSFFR